MREFAVYVRQVFNVSYRPGRSETCIANSWSRASGTLSPSETAPGTVLRHSQLTPRHCRARKPGKMLNPTLATLHKWAETLGQKLDMEVSAG